MTHATRIGIALALAALAGPAQAGGNPPLYGADRELFCTLLAESNLGSDSWGPTAPDAEYRRADDLLIDVDTQICLAHFDEALDLAHEGRKLLASLPAGGEVDRRRARLEILAGTAWIALGHEDTARRSFRMALELDPHVAVDPEETSPKVWRVFESERELQPRQASR